MKVLVTGASGFVGRHIVPAIAARGFTPVAGSRCALEFAGAEWRRAPALGPHADWSDCLRGVDVVVHAAGITRISRSTEAEEAVCRQANTEGTRSLARQAALSGVKHFLFLSSCHAVAEESSDCITACTQPNPTSAYGRSKLAAELEVFRELESSCCRWTIFRPPAVYGPHCKNGFRQLFGLVRSGLPLPFASISNRRSFIYVRNLADAIGICIGQAKSFGATFFPSDSRDVSTAELLHLIAGALPSCGDRALRLFSVHPSFFRAFGRIPFLRPLRQLVASLYVDGLSFRREMDWKPPFSMQDGLLETACSASVPRTPSHIVRI